MDIKLTITEYGHHLNDEMLRLFSKIESKYKDKLDPKNLQESYFLRQASAEYLTEEYPKEVLTDSSKRLKWVEDHVVEEYKYLDSEIILENISRLSEIIPTHESDLNYGWVMDSIEELYIDGVIPLFYKEKMEAQYIRWTNAVVSLLSSMVNKPKPTFTIESVKIRKVDCNKKTVPLSKTMAERNPNAEIKLDCQMYYIQILIRY